MKISNDKPYVIAEIGNNHHGSLKLAKKMIYHAKMAGANAVKFQKRNNKSLFTKQFYNTPFVNQNSFGKTYGEHRDFLEMPLSSYKELKSYAKKIKIDFFATPFDFESVDFLKKLNLPAYKIASGDLTNLPLQEKIAKTGKKIILSTGGGTLRNVKIAYKNISKHNKDIVIMQCTSSYPAKPEHMNLNVIKTYKKHFPKSIIGLSDHENGIDAGPIAYMLGARVFEKHFTLNRSDKGSDNAFSLEPEGLRKFIRNLYRVKLLLGSEKKFRLKSEIVPMYKMEKSIVAKNDIKLGKILKLSDLDFKSPGDGIPPNKYKKIIGKKTKRLIYKDQKIFIKDLK